MHNHSYRIIVRLSDMESHCYFCITEVRQIWFWISIKLFIRTIPIILISFILDFAGWAWHSSKDGPSIEINIREFRCEFETVDLAWVIVQFTSEKPCSHTAVLIGRMHMWATLRMCEKRIHDCEVLAIK